MVFNIGTGERHTLNDLLSSFPPSWDTRWNPSTQTPGWEMCAILRLAIEKARRFLGFEPKVSFEEGLRTHCGLVSKKFAAVILRKVR